MHVASHCSSRAVRPNNLLGVRDWKEVAEGQCHRAWTNRLLKDA